MSAQQLRTRPETEPQQNRTDTRTRPPAERVGPRAAVENSPRTFSHRNTAQLQNLIDEFNAAFADEAGESASGS